jgi:PAS domain S-box-containing protein
MASATWPILAVVVLAALFFADLATESQVVLMAVYGAGPVIAALSGALASTAAVSALAFALGVAYIAIAGEDGSQDWVRLAGIALIGVLAIWIAWLIARRDAAAASERAARARLDAIFEHVPVGLAFFDAELRYTRVNQRIAEFNGIPAAEHLGRRLSDLLPGLERQVERDLGWVLETGESLEDVEVRGSTPAQPGVEREWTVSYWPVREGRRVVGLGCVAYEVTQRRAAERALREQTDRYETLLQAVSDVGEGMLVAQDGRIVFANAAFQQMSGRSLEELRELEDAFALVAEDEREEARRRALEGMPEGADDQQLATRLQRPDGRVLDLEVAGAALEVGGVRQLVVVMRDVTARRRAEAEREALLERERVARAEAEAAHRQTRLLSETGRELDRTLDVEERIEAATRLAVADYASTCVTYLLQPDGDLRRVAVARDPATEAVLRDLHAHYPIAPTSPVLATLRSGDSQLFTELVDDPVEGTAISADHAELVRRVGTRAKVVVGLNARGRLLGAMSLGFERPLERAEGLAVVRLFEEFARRAALAIDNARLYEERAHVARTLQQSLLPSELPAVEGLELAARYLPAGEGNEVGGDFYDGFATADGWALVIGDVCGKGAEAAAVTALARYTVRAAVLHARSPSTVLRDVNEAILRQGLEYRFCTVLFAALTPRGDGGMRVRLASGGHPLPFLVRADGSVLPAGHPGTLLGIVAAPKLPEAIVDLAPGDALFMYTDGVTEATPLDPAIFGPERLAELLRARTLAGDGADAIAGAVQDAVLQVQGGTARDDVALLIARVAPLAQAPSALPGTFGLVRRPVTR